MAKSRIAVSLERKLLVRLDRMVRDLVYPSRSQAIQEALEEKLRKLDQGQLARECAKLDPALEKALAEEGMSEELVGWPEY